MAQPWDIPARARPLMRRAFAYGSAFGAVAVALLARTLLKDVLDDRSLFLLCVPAVLAASTLGGIWPGLLAVVLALGSALLIGGRAGVSAADLVGVEVVA